MAGTLSIADACRALVAQNIEPDESFLRTLARGDAPTGGAEDSISLRDLALWTRANPGNVSQIDVLRAALQPAARPQTPAELIAEARRVAIGGRYPSRQLAAARAATASDTAGVDRESVQDALALLNLEPLPQPATPCDRMGRQAVRDSDIDTAIEAEVALSSLGILQQTTRLIEANVHTALLDGYASAQRLGAGRDFVSRITLGLDGPATEATDQWLAARGTRLLDLTNAAGDDPVLGGRVRTLTTMLFERQDLGAGLRDHLEAQLAREAAAHGGDFMNPLYDDSRWGDTALAVVSLANAHDVGTGSPRQAVALAYALTTVAHDLGAARAQMNGAELTRLLERIGADGRDPMTVQQELMQRASRLVGPNGADGERLAATLQTIERSANGPWQRSDEPARVDVFSSDKAAPQISDKDVATLIDTAADDLTARLTAMTDEQRARLFASPGTISFYMGAVEKGYSPLSYQGGGQLYTDHGSVAAALPLLDPTQPEQAIAALRADLVARLTSRLAKLRSELARGTNPLERAEIRIHWPQFNRGDTQLFPQMPAPEPPTFLRESTDAHGYGMSLGDW